MNKKELNIITLGDIFKNIENEEKAFKLLYYIKQLQQENKQLKEEKQNVINYIVKELIEINKHQYAKGSRRLKKILELLGDGNE